jgi:hypothetical protein
VEPKEEIVKTFEIWSDISQWKLLAVCCLSNKIEGLIEADNFLSEAEAQ